MVEGGVAIVKYLLFISNLVLWVSGLGLLVCGTVMYLRLDKLVDIAADKSHLNAPTMLISMGCVCTLLGFLGCCGSIRENYCLTVSFAVLLALLIMLETAALVFVYAMQDSLGEKARTHALNTLHTYHTNDIVAKSWDYAQTKLNCCGVDGVSDYTLHSHAIPLSCCIFPSPHDALTPCTALPANIHAEGCAAKLTARLTHDTALVGGIVTLIASLQVTGVCFACCLSKSILKDFHDFYY